MNPHPTGAMTPSIRTRRAAASVNGATSPRRGAAPPGRVDARPSARTTHLRTVARDGEDGFTLVELLVVVLMLVALVGIAVPTFVGQQDRAQRAAVQSELRTAAIALESYRARNGEYRAEALDDASWGFVRSLDVVTHAGPIAGDTFCVRAWFNAVELGEERSAVDLDPDVNAEWAITQNGLVHIGGLGTARSCPSSSE